MWPSPCATIHEVFGGGMRISRCGWDTNGPGRHPVSSAYFWYFKNPAGAVVEYYADEGPADCRLAAARDSNPGRRCCRMEAIDGGLDGNTRRQKGVGAATAGLRPTEMKRL